jgi:S1-C subfamily serine protease
MIKLFFIAFTLCVENVICWMPPSFFSFKMAASLRHKMEPSTKRKLASFLKASKNQMEVKDVLELNDNPMWDSVVRIYCTHSTPDWLSPWQLERQHSSTSSGFVIKIEGIGYRIITNAHSVSYGSLIQVRKRGDDKKYEAYLENIGNECDLAVLKIVSPDDNNNNNVESENNDFFKDIKDLELGDIPYLQDKVEVLGYPIGGDSMSVTSGVVSRVEIQPYSQGGISLLALQIDAAINPGKHTHTHENIYIYICV